ncbi:hypothetical protein BurJ1DRAFT_3390 [Burkholderiales bacterium JOSHI_001]|nr:hypothetical protein BurJ1DRAFT_3390 [Burkholderiales bacterium JOSHI_001]
MAVPEPSEFEVKFAVPAASRAQVAAEVSRGAGFQGRRSLTAMYLDTPDGRLAAAGLAWRLRRESRRWVQTLKARSGAALLRIEHEVPCATPTPDATRHAGTPAGERLLALLHTAQRDGLQVEVRFRTEVRRSTRVIRTRGAVVELAFDEGQIVAGPLQRRVRELEFECLSGSRTAMLDLARRWQQRFGLLLDPLSKSERGSLLANGQLHPPVRKAALPRFAAGAPAGVAFAAVLDECLDQVLRNAAGLCDGAREQRVEHVHQLRVGLRRLRSALRSFRGWVQAPPPPLVDGLQALFTELGRTRDNDMMAGSVAADLAAAGGPPWPARPATQGRPPAVLLRAPPTQGLLLDWLRWQATDRDTQGGMDPASKSLPPSDHLRRRARKRLRAWHKRLAQQAQAFDTLDETSLHALRKRIKRQRYAVEFLAPLLPRRALTRDLPQLTRAQARMGELHDLFVLQAHCQTGATAAPAARFALTWLAERIAEARAGSRTAVHALSGAEPPLP